MWYIWTSDHFNAHSFRWVKAFKAGKFSVEDDTRPGRPKTSVTKANIAAVKIVVKQDARLSVKDIAVILAYQKAVCKQFCMISPDRKAHRKSRFDLVAQRQIFRPITETKSRSWELMLLIKFLDKYL